MGSSDRKAVAHRVYSMVNANLLLLNCGNENGDL